MSVNLHCDQVPLFQTPTEDTYAIFDNRNGGWKGIKQRYIKWLEEYIEVANNEYHEAEARQQIDQLNKRKRLTFWIG